MAERRALPGAPRGDAKKIGGAVVRNRVRRLLREAVRPLTTGDARRLLKDLERETNRIWDQSGTRIIGYRNGRNEQIVDMGTPDGASRYYRGITAALNKRQGRLRSYLSYTISQLRGTVFNNSPR